MHPGLGLRRRFWFEAASFSAGMVLLGLTVAWPDWIELAFGVDPDGGSGLLEWLIVLVSLIVMVVAATVARREWRRTVVLWTATASATGSSGPV